MVKISDCNIDCVYGCVLPIAPLTRKRERERGLLVSGLRICFVSHAEIILSHVHFQLVTEFKENRRCGIVLDIKALIYRGYLLWNYSVASHSFPGVTAIEKLPTNTHFSFNSFNTCQIQTGVTGSPGLLQFYFFHPVSQTFPFDTFFINLVLS